MKKQTHIFRLLGILILFVTLQSGGCKKDTGPQDNPLYGTPGPAGGLVFYDKGFYSDGWRYLEVAPYDIHTPVFWGCERSIPGLLEGIGSGESNTANIVAYQINPANDTPDCITSYQGTSSAAIVCSNFSLNGYDDWFLPSIEELDLIIQNVYQKNVGNIYPYQSYWSSSQASYDPIIALGKRADSFTYSYLEKYCAARIRAVRAY